MAADFVVIYTATTHAIRVSVEPIYLDDQSSPAESRFIWAYHVRIENGGIETVTLRTRHWQITDAFGRVQEVHGTGVVGVEPILAPGESFEYTSGTPLNSPSGMMVGSYEMERESGERFHIEIPAFSLDSPHEPRQVH